MCELIKPLSKKQFTGYKVVIKTKTGKYLSLYTGMEYKENMKVKKIRKFRRLSDGVSYMFDIPDILDRILGKIDANCRFLKSNYYGYTSVYTTKDYGMIELGYFNHTTIYVDNGKYVLLKMTLHNDLYESSHNNTPTVSGKYIGKITEVKL
jgi:hypothetical protein